MIIIRFITWIIRRLGIYTVLSLLLLSIALGSVVRGLMQVNPTLELRLILLATGGGLLLGWGLAKSPLPAWLAGLIGFILTGELLGIWVGRLGEPLLELGRPLLSAAGTLRRWPLNEPPDLAPALTALARLLTHLNVLLLRLFNWLITFSSGSPRFDPVAAALFWGLILAGIAAWAGWLIRRQAAPLPALLPAGALLAILMAHTRAAPMPLIPFLGALLLLLTLVRHRAREQRWQAGHVRFSHELRTDLALAVTPVLVVLLGLATLLPHIPVRQITHFTRELIWGATGPDTGQAAEALGLQSRPEEVETPLTSLRTGGLPRRHLIGSGPELSEQMVMAIHTGDPRSDTVEAAPRYYWRSVTYDLYVGRGWLTGPLATHRYRASQPVLTTTLPYHRPLQQTVEVLRENGGLVYAAGEMVTVDQDFRLSQRSQADFFAAELVSPAISVPAAPRESATPGLRLQENVLNPEAIYRYQVESQIPAPDAAILRAAGENYPAWIRDRYLNLPPTVPDRVLTLARDLTAAAPAPYDRAIAIERYLRQFPYTLDLPPPPTQGDITDYFLFDLRQGYCDYYATAMVVLARAAGLPARFVMGYLNGVYEPETDRYLVSEAEAHSWVEIYFPGAGWVTFEPTAGRPALERDETAAVVEAAAPPPVPPPPAPATGPWLLWGVLLAGCLLIGGGLAWGVVEQWCWQRLTPAGTIAVVNEQLYRQARQLHTPLTNGDTPYEVAGALTEQLGNLAMRSRWRDFLKPAPREIGTLIDLYVRACYSPHHLETSDQAQAIALWQRLRRRLWLARLAGRREA